MHAIKKKKIIFRFIKALKILRFAWAALSDFAEVVFWAIKHGDYDIL